MSDPYRTSPEVIERIIEVPVDRIVEKIVYKDRIVEKIPNCKFARCPACQADVEKIEERIRKDRKDQTEYYNLSAYENAKSHARSAEKYVEILQQLILRKCEH